MAWASPGSRQHLLSIWQVPAHDERNLLLPQLLDGNLQRIRLALEVDQHRRVHAARSVSQIPRLTLLPEETTYLICSALVPKMRAFSYLVINGVVLRWSLGIFLSLCDLSLPLPWLAAALGSPDATTWSASRLSPSCSGAVASSPSARSGSGS